MIGRALWVTCELCDDEVALTGNEATVARVRAEAYRQGWTCRAGRDYCPEHKRLGDHPMSSPDPQGAKTT